MPKEKLDFYMIISFAVILGLLTDYLFYKKEVGVSFFIFILASIAFSLAIAKRFGQKLGKIQILLLVSAVILSAGVFLRASSFLGFFNVIGGVYLLFLSAILFAEKDFFTSRILRYISAPIAFFLESFSSSAKFINEQKNLIANKDRFGSKEFRSVIKGIIMSLPILAILGWFLYSADLVVQAYANKLFSLLDFKINLELFSRILIIFAVSYIFIGIFSRIAGKKKIETAEETNSQNKSVGFIESMTVLALVELLFLAFITIQFFYLFGGKSYVWGINEYITYSEYAKSGFYELIKVAIVSFILIYAVAEYSKMETLKEKNTFKFLTATLFVEISVILLSSLKRLFLYTDGYGLTLSRFLAFAFLFWIFCVFLFFLYKILLGKKKAVFIFMTFSLSATVWIGINILNPDALIAKVNIDRFAQGKKLDPFYFSSLSEDAVPEIVKIFKLNVDDGIKERVAMDLDRKYVSHDYICNMMPHDGAPYDSYSISQCKPALFSERIKAMETKSPWQSFNLSKMNVLRVLKDNADKIDKYEISYWEKAISACKKGAAECEADCAKYDSQPINECKNACIPQTCEELEKNIKEYK